MAESLKGNVLLVDDDPAVARVLGALLGSTLWFTALGFGARYLGRFLSSPRSWQVLDGVVAVTMVAVAGMLAVG